MTSEQRKIKRGGVVVHRFMLCSLHAAMFDTHFDRLVVSIDLVTGTTVHL